MHQLLKFLKKNNFVLSLLIFLGLYFGSAGDIMAQVTSPMWDYPVDLTQSSSSTNAIDPLILCDRYQNTHILWGDRDEMPALYYMNDTSGEWTAPVDVIANRDNTSLVMRLSAAIQHTPDILHVLWIDEYINGVLNYSRVDLSQANNPRAWINPVPIAIGVENGSIEVDENGKLHVVYGVSGGDSSEVLVNYIYSENNGETWSAPNRIFSKKVPFPSDPITSLDIDTRGRIHLGISIRSQDYGAYSEIGYMRSPDGGVNWSDYLLIDDLGTAFQGVNLLTPYSFEGDEVHLTWHDPRRMHQWSYDGGSTWSEPIEIMPLGAAFGGSNGLTKDSDGKLYVVTAENGGVFSASWEGPRWGPPERIEDRFIDPHGQSITICQGNKLQIVYDDRSDTQKIWYSYRVVNAHDQIRVPISTPAAFELAGNNQNPDQGPTEEFATANTTPEFHNGSELEEFSSQESLPSNPIIPIIIASGIVIGLILVVFLLKR